jgi:hypothetical protein
MRKVKGASLLAVTTKRKLCDEEILRVTSAYAQREYKSMSVYTYRRDPSGNMICTVSASRRLPGAIISGLSV